MYSVPFSLSDSLGGGSGKRTQKPLGSHQERISITMKDNNTSVLRFTDQIMNRLLFPALKNLTLETLYINRINPSFAWFHSYHLLTHYFAQRHKKNLAPNKRTNFYSQNDEILRWRTASIKFGQNKGQTTASTWFEWCMLTPKIGQRSWLTERIR